MNVGGDWFNVMFLHQSSLMEATKESDLQLSISRFLSDHFSRPVGETLLFGVDNLVERSAGLGKPIFVVPANNILHSVGLLMGICYLILFYLRSFKPLK